jgi:hypothetical protein
LSSSAILNSVIGFIGGFLFGEGVPGALFTVPSGVLTPSMEENRLCNSEIGTEGDDSAGGFSKFRTGPVISDFRLSTVDLIAGPPGRIKE